MNTKHLQIIAKDLTLEPSQIQAVISLLEQDATIPFIARYRKESTGSLDEVAIRSVRDKFYQLKELDLRRSAILKSLEKNGHLTDELKASVETSPTLAVLEDIYLPFRPKRRTKATIARERGLEPLALVVFEQTATDPENQAKNFMDAEKGIESIEAALSGARDIIAEMINENKDARRKLRELFASKGVIKSRVATDMETHGIKYKDYFEWIEPVAAAPSHRILAMRRGEKEDILNLTFAPAEDDAIQILENLFIQSEHTATAQVKIAIYDCYKRLLSRSMETELRVSVKERADAQAIKVFADNLRHLLLAPPLGSKRIMAVDPGFRTGCKIVCLNRQGKPTSNATIFPHSSKSKVQEAEKVLMALCDENSIEAVAVGNGTAGRETKAFIEGFSLANNPAVILVDESGASIYSASKAAREEFPDLDLTLRGAISIGRRLMDPLAELVKIDPKSIGVGQYQHDVDQTALKGALDDIVISCVNNVGVDVNCASTRLLTYVSGLGPQLAANIQTYRDENGPFESREELKKIPRLGPRAFEQSAGFLRINNGNNPLDASAVHPESYPIVYRMADDLGCSIENLMADAALRDKIDLTQYITRDTGIPTLKDILNELARPGRDPRKTFEVFEFADGIEKIEDLKSNMTIPGIITNVTAFGAFVDIGVHVDGLVHISELSHKYVKDPSEVVKVQQKVLVRVIDVDLDRNRISLSMKTEPLPRKHKVKKRKKSLPKKPSGTKPQKKVTSKSIPEPFNNPFAELLGKAKK